MEHSYSIILRIPPSLLPTTSSRRFGRDQYCGSQDTNCPITKSVTRGTPVFPLLFQFPYASSGKPSTSSGELIRLTPPSSCPRFLSPEVRSTPFSSSRLPFSIRLMLCRHLCYFIIYVFDFGQSGASLRFSVVGW